MAAADLISRLSLGAKTKTALIYTASLAVCLLALVWVLKLWRADLAVPFAYKGDGLFNGLWFKGIIDNGWYLYNDYVGAPTGMAMADFPSSDNLHFFLGKIISLFTGDFALTMNLFYLLTFPLTTASALFVFRKLKISWPAAVFGSLLFTFLPYHFVRGESHLFLASIYVIPLTVLLILRAGSESPPFIRFDKKGGMAHDLISWRTAGFVLIAIATASAGVYYAFFACIFLLAAGAYAAVRQRSLKRILVRSAVAAGAIALIGVFLLINMAPNLSYQSKYGKNDEAVERRSIETDVFGMTISQLLLPVSSHRLHFLDEPKKDLSDGATYMNVTSVFINENDTATLGLIGSIGLLASLGWLIVGKRNVLKESLTDRSLLDQLGVMNITAILVATMGGLGLIFSLLVTPDIRAYNRISPYIAFFSIGVVLVLLESLRRRFFAQGKKSLIFLFALPVFLLVGVLDQTNDNMVPPYSFNNAQYASDDAFVKNIESSVSPGARIFQLPYMPFPEGGAVNKVTIYDHFRAYLHSSTLHWSYGVMKGRPGDEWQRAVVSKPIDQMLQELAKQGFTGIYVNRAGYPDNANQVVQGLESALHVKPIANAERTLLFYNMTDYAKTVS